MLERALGGDARAKVPAIAPERRTIVVLNAKGGCGKTTLATNLATFYANAGVSTALVDHDPQGSSTHWLEARGANLPRLAGVAAWRHQGPVTRTFLMRDAKEARRVVHDTPAAVGSAELARLLPEADRIVVPVLPSSIDIRAGARFLGAVLLDPSFRRRRPPITVVANRVRQNTLVFKKLERFLATLEIPFVATFRDTQLYVHAAERGEGLFDSRRREGERERESLLRLATWIEQAPAPRATVPARPGVRRSA